jgi:ATP-dependent Clp protease, protease subunit
MMPRFPGLPPHVPRPLPSAGPAAWNAWVEADLFDRRTLLLTGPLDDLTAGTLAARLMALDAAGDESITLQVNGSGGTLTATATLMDTIDLLGVPVHATCLGRAEGPALFVLAVCHERSAGPRSWLRLDEPATETTGPANRLADWAAMIRTQLDQVLDRVAAASRLDRADLDEAVSRGRAFTPDAALAAGLIDRIAKPDADIVRFPRPVGFRPRD